LDKETLYELRPAEFERLCAEILKAQGFKSVQFVDGPADQGVDVIAQTEGRPVAVQVKHTRRLSHAGLRDIVLRLKANPYQANDLLVITSATATAADKAFLSKLSSQGVSVRLLAQDDLLEILSKHPESSKQWFRPPGIVHGGRNVSCGLEWWLLSHP
jgi:HJR/Mrr/RecB family endonuclease